MPITECDKVAAPIVFDQHKVKCPSVRFCSWLLQVRKLPADDSLGRKTRYSLKCQSSCHALAQLQHESSSVLLAGMENRCGGRSLSLCFGMESTTDARESHALRNSLE
jgi:hypothetical protein